jgi:hypothetical protein
MFETFTVQELNHKPSRLLKGQTPSMFSTPGIGKSTAANATNLRLILRQHWEIIAIMPNSTQQECDTLWLLRQGLITVRLN